MNGKTHQVARVLKLDDGSIRDQASEIIRTLAGVESVEVAGLRQLCISYDVTLLSWATLCDALKRAGLYAQRGWIARWRDGWRDQLDHNMRDNLTHRAACCSKPPPGAGRR